MILVGGISVLSRLRVRVTRISRRALAPGFCRTNRGLAPSPKMELLQNTLARIIH